MNQDISIKRLGIFAFYDKDGIVDDYVIYMLRDLSENLTDLIVVVNGDITSEGQAALKQFTDKIVIRKNEGFDFGAWKYALTVCPGWDEVCAYDELVLVNNTFFGPFYPFRQVFEEMDLRSDEVDFWGLTAFCDYASGDTVNYPPDGNIPQHIQSYEFTFRSRILHSQAFRQFWTELPAMKSYWDAVLYGETALTCYFEKAGFTWDVYLDCSDLDVVPDKIELGHAYCMSSPHLLLERGLPIMKIKCFSLPSALHYRINCNEEVRKSLSFIREKTVYDERMIFQNVLRRLNITDIHDVACFNYVLPSRIALPPMRQHPKVLVVCHLYYMDLLEEEMQYFRAIPDYMDVLVTTTSEERRAAIENVLRPLFGNRLRIAVMPQNRGRDIAALLVLARPYISDYEYVCFCKDKKSSTAPALTGISFARYEWENALCSESYVENIMHTFSQEPCLGLLVPPPYTGSDFLTICGSSLYWTVNYDITVELAKELNLNVPISKDKLVLTIGTTFWARTAALKPLLEHEFEYEDFPAEPMPTDNTVNHAVERIFAFVAQQAGYYTGWVMTQETASSMIRIEPRVECGLRQALKRYAIRHLPDKTVAFISRHMPAWLKEKFK